MAVLRELFPVIKLGIEKIKPRIAAINSVIKIDWKPNKNPIPAKSLASPKPIASTFLIFLYKTIINQITKYPKAPPNKDWNISWFKFKDVSGKKFFIIPKDIREKFKLSGMIKCFISIKKITTKI